MYNTFLLTLIKKTVNFAENLKVTTGGGKDIYKSLSHVGHAIKVTWDNSIVKERREESYDNMLPVLSEFTQENFRHTKKKYRKKITLKRLQAPKVANISVSQ